jgi:hypothetical protein
MRRLTPSHSWDGLFWWDGRSWLPAYDASGRWWFDGRQWVPAVSATARPAPPRWVLVGGAAWLLALLASIVVAVVALVGADEGSRKHMSTGLATALLACGAAALLATLAWGAALGRARRWRDVLFSAGAGTGLLIAAFAMAWLVGPNANEPGADNAAGAGAAVFSMPAFVALSVPLWLGAAIGLLLPRPRSGREERAEGGAPAR